MRTYAHIILLSQTVHANPITNILHTCTYTSTYTYARTHAAPYMRVHAHLCTPTQYTQRLLRAKKHAFANIRTQAHADIRIYYKPRAHMRTRAKAEVTRGQNTAKPYVQ